MSMPTSSLWASRYLPSSASDLTIAAAIFEASSILPKVRYSLKAYFGSCVSHHYLRIGLLVAFEEVQQLEEQRLVLRPRHALNCRVQVSVSGLG